MVELLCVKFDDPSCIGLFRHPVCIKRQTNFGKSRTLATAVGMSNDDASAGDLCSVYFVNWCLITCHTL